MMASIGKSGTASPRFLIAIADAISPKTAFGNQPSVGDHYGVLSLPTLECGVLRVATIFDGFALAMIDGEVGPGEEADGVSGSASHREYRRREAGNASGRTVG